MKEPTVRRLPRNKDHPYVITARSFCEDMDISMPLKALLLYCFSRPDDWEYHVSHLACVHKICTKKCLKLLKEGIDKGYISREIKKEGNLNCGVTYYFCEDKSFSNNITDSPETSLSKELFEKYKKLESESRLSNNVTDKARFGHAEKDPLRYNEERKNNERYGSNGCVQKIPKAKREIPKILKIQALSERDQQIIANSYTDSQIVRALEDTQSYHENKEKVRSFAAFITDRCKFYKNKGKK